MNDTCEIVRDLIPLYIDGVASSASGKIIKEHIAQCRDCQKLLAQMQNDEVVQSIAEEKESVLANQSKRFRRRSAVIGSIIAGILMIPVVVCLIVNLAAGTGFGWFFIVLASLLTVASLIIVPLTVSQNKLLITLASFTVSLILLLGVCCLYVKGRWFFTAGTSSLFGLNVVFLPFAVRSKPLAAILKKHKGLAVLGVDTILYGAMLYSIARYTQGPEFLSEAAAVSLPFVLFLWSLLLFVWYGPKSGWLKAGFCILLTGFLFFFANTMICLAGGYTAALPVLNLTVWDPYTIDGNVKWLILLTCILIGAIFSAIGIAKRSRKR